jgi:hypothetical protein
MEIKEGDISIFIDIPGNMMNKIYSKEQVNNLTLREVFTYTYFDFCNGLLKSVASIEFFAIFLYYRLGIEKLSKLIYNEFKINKDSPFVERVFIRLIYHKSEFIVLEAINKIKEMDEEYYSILANKFRRILK